MKKLIFKYVFIWIIVFANIGNSRAQIFEHADDEETKLEGQQREVFAKDPIFEKKGGISKRSSGGATFDSDLTYGGGVPIDGGLSVFICVLLGYGIKKMKKRRLSNNV
jgi:hypothetical protein